jgi:hypothetical protein
MRSAAESLGHATASRRKQRVELTAIDMIRSHQGLCNWILKKVGQRRLPGEVILPIRCHSGLIFGEPGNAPGARDGVAADPCRHLKDGFTEMQAMALTRRRHPMPTRGQTKLPGVSLFDPLGEM